MGKRKVEMHITKWIAQRRAALEQEVHSMEGVVAQLSKTAEFHKDQGSHGVHMSLRKAQDQLAERKRRLTEFNSKYPVSNN
jgi:hypothetical protein